MKHAILYVTLFTLITASAHSTTPPLAAMTLEEKVGQLLMVHFHGQTANDEAKLFINNLHVGSIIYYTWANGLINPDQVKNLSSELQKIALLSSTQLPLIIAIDHEGGRVHWFKDGFTHFPPAYTYTLCNDPTLTEQCAYAMASELRAAGITMNLAPIADVMSNPNNPVIGTRACGTTPDTVITHAHALLRGFHQAGIATSLKHFPGHGDTNVDSHLAMPLINKNFAQLSTGELAPFYALAPETDSIMTAHIMVPALDPLHCATLSPSTLNMLRKEANFNGIIISDSLVMAGITNSYATIGEAAIQAFNAGCDILLLGGKQLIGAAQKELSYHDVAIIHQTLVDAVRTGRISQQRLDEAVAKIIALKKKYPLTDNTPPPKYRAHQHLSCTVAQRALKALTETPHNLPDTVFETLKTQLTHLTEVYHENRT